MPVAYFNCMSLNDPNETRAPRRLVTVTGPDRPGLVAAVSRIFAEEGVDLEDVSMTRLSGNFATMLLARGGDEVLLKGRLQAMALEYGLLVHIEPAVEHGEEPEADCYISAVGPNRTGIVAAISEVLAEQRVNILEMATRLLERTRVPVYMVRMEVVTGPGGEEKLREALEKVASGLGVELRVEPVERNSL